MVFYSLLLCLPMNKSVGAVNTSNKAAWERFAFVLNTSDPAVYRGFDWSKLTTIVLFDFVDSDVIAMARKNNVRVAFKAVGPELSESELTKSSSRRRWIKAQLKYALQHGLDGGINVDFEGPMTRGGPGAKGYSKLIEDLASVFHRQVRMIAESLRTCGLVKGSSSHTRTIVLACISDYSQVCSICQKSLTESC